ncbi:hypothetical protein HU200_015639 [Digitaria exilis]|uniref:NB-ARC domain-containing protein n=1 Tax=Digitaria exilis TaxID=1010633 RepID=A0A835F8E0_9POAL|nr:hypothetical protein HU200_015639 [Digitaria exilis]
MRDDDMTQEYFTESLVVVDGVQSTDKWNEIKPSILSGDNKCCVVVVTDNHEVARHCVDDNHDRLVHVSQVDVDEGHHRIFSCRGEEAMASIRNKFDELHGVLPIAWRLFENWFFDDERQRHDVLSVLGMAGIGKTAMVQWACNKQILVSEESEGYRWVDVPHPFSLSELSWRLLLQFLSDDLQAMETAMLAIIQGQDPIQVCRKWLHKLANWILVLDGLRSMDEWDSIKTSFLVPEPTDRNRIIVITDQESVAMHCVDKDKKRVYVVEALEFAIACPVLVQKSYLETCKDELKPCIFYLSVFPMGLSIRPMRLTRRWIAEGYCKGTSSHTAEGNGQRLFFELVGLSIIHQQLRRSRYTWKYPVNGFFHEYITSRPMEHNLVFALEGNCGLNSPRVGQHLTVRNDWHRDKNVFESTDFSRLRSFTVFGECRPFMFDPEKIKMTYVRVLDLEDASDVTDKDLKHIVEVFPRLKFLSLRGQRQITCLPDSLGGLMQLQTLDVRDTSIASLPEAIMKLQKLQYVRAGMRPVPWNEGCSVVEVKAPAEDAPMPSMAMVEDTAASAAAPSSIPEPAEDTAEDAPMPSMAIVEDTAASAAAPSSILEPAEGTRAATTATEAPRRCLPQGPVAEGAPMAPTTSWLSKLRCRRRRLDNTIFGIELPAGSGQLTTLHTLGVINLGAGKSVNLKELSKLTQLRRLGVCGLNADNISEFFSAIKDLNRLESLSVRVDKNKDGSLGTLDSKIFELLPKSLTKKFSLQGHVLPGSWIKKLANVRMLDLEITLEKQQDMTSIIDGLREHPEKILYWHDKSRTRICLKTIHGGELSICIDDELKLDILEIVCTCSLQATIGSNKLSAMMLKIHCSSGSSLQLSGLQDIAGLDEVWLKGSYSDALKKNLLQQAAKHPAPKHNKVYFRVLKPRLPKPDK